MSYRDMYPACDECPFLQRQQTERDMTHLDIQDSEMLIVAKQAALEHYIDVATNINTYILLKAMAAKEFGADVSDVNELLDKVESYDKDTDEVTMRSNIQINEARSYISLSKDVIDAIDQIVAKVAEDCPGYDISRRIGEAGCKSTLIPFIDT
jgi:hypothetical protein